MSRLILLCFILTSQIHAADKPLVEAAKTLAAKLPAGCIATGERINGQTSFAITGKAPEKATPETLVFEIGSITKVFTGLLLAQAVVEGKVKLETTVATLLGPQQTFADSRIGAITLLQLSTHTSGLPRLPDNLAAGSVEGDPYAKYDEALLLAYLKAAKLKGEPPFTASYSNLGVGLLGHLLGKVFQTSWEDAAVKKICLPLGMKNTSVHQQHASLIIAPPFAGKKAVKPWHLASLVGAGALRSTVTDMMKFGSAIAEPEKSPLKDALAIALKPHSDFGSASGKIGLGITMRALDGHTAYAHDGGTGGYRSCLQVIPSRGIVRVALVNNSDLDGSEVIAATREVKAMSKPKEIALTADELQEFPGVYALDNDSRFTILLHDDQLWVRLTGQAFLPVSASAPDRFFYKAVEAVLQFHREANGVKAVTLFQNGHELKATRTSDPVPVIKLRTAKELQPYVGKYALMGMKEMVVKVRGSTLYAQLADQPEVPVFESAPDRFEYDVVEAVLAFSRDAEKKINGLTLLQNGMTLPAPRKAK